VRNLVVILATLFVLPIPATCLSSQFFITLGPEVRYVNGHSTYHISFPGEQSELEFPLDNVMAGLKVIAGDKFKENPQQTKSQISLTLITVVDQDAGIMKDSDWIENDGHPGKDIYTESDAKLRGAVFEIRYAYHFRYNDMWTIGPVIGYRYQKLDYDIYGYRGYRYSTPLYGEGKVLEYEVTYKIPYIGLTGEGLIGNKHQFRFVWSFGYSNWTEVTDRDDHILRYKLSEGGCEGEAYLVNVGLDWNFLPQWILGVGAEYVDIDATGTQHQRFYAGSSAGTTYDVDDRISSSLLSGMVRVLYEF
jgi:outer membrane protease